MKLSIITCTYNRLTYLQQCLDSVISQNLPDDQYEHIFIDGFSNDWTFELIQSYQRQYPHKNIRYLQVAPKWIYPAMNEGVRFAQGEYVTFLNSDDYYAHNVLSKYLDFIQTTWNLDFYYGKIHGVSECWVPHYELPAGRIFQQGLHKQLLGMVCYTMHPSILYKKSLHDQVGFYTESYKIVSDWEFFIKLWLSDSTSKFFPHVVTNYRMHDASASHDPKNSLRFQQEIADLRKNYYSFFHQKVLFSKLFCAIAEKQYKKILSV